MLIFSMSVSVYGFIADRQGDLGWTPPDEELFGFHLEQVSALGGYLLGRRLYEAMLVWRAGARPLRTGGDDREADGADGQVEERLGAFAEGVAGELREVG